MKLYITIFLTLLQFRVYAQLQISGRVLDNQKNGLAFINVFIENSTKGTTTDENGYFKLNYKKKRGVLKISSIGFITQTVKVNKKTKPLTIILEEGTDVLEEVIIVSKPKKRLTKKENPAYYILRELWKKKRNLGLKQSKTYQYKKHTTTEFGLNNLDIDFLKTLLGNEYDTLKENIKYDSDGINYYLPLYLKEKVTRIYGDNTINEERRDIEAERFKGLKADGFVFDRLNNTFIDFNIFDDNINFLKKSFVSPLSKNGFSTYDYVLYDSIVNKKQKLYNIYFFPRRNGDFAFQGNVWISDKNFSVEKIKMEITKKAGLNFVRDLNIYKEFTLRNDSIYIPKKNIYEGDFTLVSNHDNQKGLNIKQTDIFDEFDFKIKYPKNFYRINKKKLRPKQFEKPEHYWKNYKSVQEQETLEIIQRVKSKSKIKSVSETMNFIVSGFYKINDLPIQIGELATIYSSNDIEGSRFRLSLRSFRTKDDRFRTEGYIAYGQKDKKIKYGISTNYLISYEPRIALKLQHQNDVKQLATGQIDTRRIREIGLNKAPVITRGSNFFLSRVQKYNMDINYAVTNNFRFGLEINRDFIESATSKNEFSIDYLSSNNSIEKSVTDVSSKLYLCYTPNRRVYGLGVNQRFGKELFPSVLLTAKRGLKGFLNGTHNYTKLQFQYAKPFILGQFGVSSVTLESGKIFGTVPLALLNPAAANQSYFIKRNSFALLNYYDYVMDTYSSIHYEHHLDGFIFNKIPLVKKLKLRSLFTFRALYGKISEENKKINRSNIIYNSPNKKPYYEYGIGIENIGYGNFKILRVDAIWRTSSYESLNKLAIPSPKFAIRLGINTSL